MAKKRTARAPKPAEPVVVARGENGASWWIERQGARDYAAYADATNYLGSRSSSDEARRLISDYLYPDPR